MKIGNPLVYTNELLKIMVSELVRCQIPQACGQYDIQYDFEYEFNDNH